MYGLSLASANNQQAGAIKPLAGAEMHTNVYTSPRF
jgi:hypothetical protein